MISARNRKKGIILVESLVAIFLLASIVMFTTSSFVVGKHITRLSKERFIVSNLLREDMESLLATNYTNLTDGTVVSNIIVNDGVRSFPAVKTLVVQTIDSSIYGYKQIYGKIAWAGGITNSQVLLEEMVLYVTK